MPAAVWLPRGAPIPGKDRRASLETVPFRRERSTSQNATPVDARARGCRNSRYTRAERLPFQPKKAAPEPKQDGDCQRQVEAHGADGSYAVHAFIPWAPEWTPCRSDTPPPPARRADRRVGVPPRCCRPAAETRDAKTPAIAGRTALFGQAARGFPRREPEQLAPRKPLLPAKRRPTRGPPPGS